MFAPSKVIPFQLLRNFRQKKKIKFPPVPEIFSTGSGLIDSSSFFSIAVGESFGSFPSGLLSASASTPFGGASGVIAVFYIKLKNL